MLRTCSVPQCAILYVTVEPHEKKFAPVLLFILLFFTLPTLQRRNGANWAELGEQAARHRSGGWKNESVSFEMRLGYLNNNQRNFF